LIAGRPDADQTRLRIGVVGAGISGLVAARALRDRGHDVRIFDKGRGPGGRMSTRRHDTADFDHGAQYFTVRDPRFAAHAEEWRRDGVVAPWRGVIVELCDGKAQRKEGSPDRLVGVPRMSAVTAHLATGLEVAAATRVDRIELDPPGWRLESDGTALGTFDAVLVSAPAAQSAALLDPVAPALAERAREAVAAPCWAAMVAFAEPLEVDFDGAFVKDSPLSWVARNDSKPGRRGQAAWTLHATPAWSREHLDLAPEQAAARLLAAFRHAAGVSLPEPIHQVGHRWLYALPEDPLPELCLFDPDRRLGACGDWCGGPRVEGAFLSGLALAQRLGGEAMEAPEAPPG